MVDTNIESNLDNDFAQLLKESFSKEIKEGQIIEGIIKEVTPIYFIIDVGLKSEGFIDSKELNVEGSDIEYKAGDKIEVFLEAFEGRDGRILLSRKRVLQEKSWSEMKEKHEKDEVIEGVISGRVKGGFIVDVGHVTAFLPGSQVDMRPVKDISFLLGHDEQFKILKMDDLRGNVVVSRRAILQAGHQKAVDKILADIEEGQILDGVVKNITNYGAFIDLGTVDGLVHIADISWNRISHPSEILSLGEKIKVKVIKYDAVKKQISLGIKQLKNDPWADFADKLQAGNKLKGKITNITDYGLFVELQKGIEGLVHMSEISWVKGSSNPLKALSSGEEVEVVILEVDESKHRISLSIKRAGESPWDKFQKSFKKDDIVEGKVKTFTDYGFYVEVQENIDGLVHSSDLSWSGNVKQEMSKYKVGDQVKVKITELDIEKERLGLGIKQLQNDPFAQVEEAISRENQLTCVIKEVRNDGLLVALFDDLEVFIKRSDLSKDKSDQRTDRFAVGEKIDAKVTKIDKVARKINMSIKALEIQDEKAAIKEYGSAVSGASLGDILGGALDQTSLDKDKK
jgi:small subunit ribosomal protein S1